MDEVRSPSVGKVEPEGPACAAGNMNREDTSADVPNVPISSMENRNVDVPYRANEPRPQKQETADPWYQWPQGFPANVEWNVYDMKPVNDDEITSESELIRSINYCLSHSSVQRAFRAGHKTDLLDAVWYCMYDKKKVDKLKQTVTHSVVDVDKNGKVSRKEITMPFGNCPNCFTVGCLGTYCKVCTNMGLVIGRISFTGSDSELPDALGLASLIQHIPEFLPFEKEGEVEGVMAEYAAIPTLDKAAVDKALRRTSNVVHLKYESTLAKKVMYHGFFDTDAKTSCMRIAECVGVPYAVARNAHYKHLRWEDEEDSSSDGGNGGSEKGKNARKRKRKIST